MTETFPYGAETLVGPHCLPCVFQIGPAFLGKNETEQQDGVMPGPLPADGVVPCERTPHEPVKFPPCNEYFQTIVPLWNATQPTRCGFVHAVLPFVLAEFFSSCAAYSADRSLG